jgi:uncharacterized membrane protein
MKRPWQVTVCGFLFIAVGLMGLVYHYRETPHDRDFLLISAVRLLAVIGGVFLLLGQNWARWLLLAWLGFHVVVSAFHSAQETIAHIIFLIVIGYALLRPPGSTYFRTIPS